MDTYKLKNHKKPQKYRKIILFYFFPKIKDIFFTKDGTFFNDERNFCSIFSILFETPIRPWYIPFTKLKKPAPVHRVLTTPSSTFSCSSAEDKCNERRSFFEQDTTRIYYTIHAIRLYSTRQNMTKQLKRIVKCLGCADLLTINSDRCLF